MEQGKNFSKRYLRGSSLVVICVFVTLIGWSFYVRQPLLPATYRLAKIIFFFTLTVLDFKVSVWMILVVGLIVAGLRHERARREQTAILKTGEPVFFAYRKAVLIKWLWVWDYRIIPNTGDYIISDLKPSCNADETPLVLNDDMSYTCPKCGTRYGGRDGGEYAEPEEAAEIFGMIEDNIRKMPGNRV